MRFYDDRIRFRYFMDPKKLIIGKFTNSSKEETYNTSEIETITLKRTSGYENEFKFTYNNDKLLHGL